MLIADAIHIWRDADGEYHLEWEASQPDTRVTVESLDSAGRAHYPDGLTAGARVSGLPATNTHFFRLRDQHGNEAVAAERKLGMQGTPNFRDFGGYKTAGGQQLKWGYLFRSGQLSRLTEQDVALLGNLELDLICDFRQVQEQEGDPSRLPAERSPRVLSLPITPGSNANFFEQAGEGFGGRQTMFDFMVEINRDFALAQTETYARMFREVLSVSDARFLVHCAAGKDRTGFAAAIVLLALGVPREVVLRDYLMTARYFNPSLELDRIRQKYQMDLEADAILPMLEVHSDYLSAALAAIDERYPSIEAYLAEELGVGPAELAELKGRYLM
ncbi:MAG: tyrosine-protein phosphatase [Halioglobus sp.]